ncbi:IS21 family transposase [Yaniella flava]|uniref:IS21 family transposase n=1 Tax=Yaniella flava TaxID=287930 RepID=A0ABP5G5N4_9MICC
MVTEHDYPGSYSPVQRFVKQWRAEHRQPSEGYGELDWSAGTIQVDFGQAEAIIAGVRLVLHVLVVTFPFSNMRFAQAYRGETAECVCHGLRTIFEHIGLVPTLMIFDNATGIGKRVADKVIETTLFSAFRLHYRTHSRYCNPASGHEKGSVENAVGFLRRNLMVPEPHAVSLEALNTTLLAQCDELAGEQHYRHDVPIRQLFDQDLAACLPLPGIGFDPVRYEPRKTDKRGYITVESNTYAAGPAFHSRALTVGIRADTIEILDEHANPVVTFQRVFGHHPDTIFQPAALLPLLATKPGSWSHSLVRTAVSDPLRDWLDTASMPQRRKAFTGLAAAAQATDFDTATTAATTLITTGDTPSSAALGMLARRMAQGSQPTTTVVNLDVYDQLTDRKATA